MEHAAGQSRLAAAGLADDAEHLASPEFQRDLVHGRDQLVAHEALALDLERLGEALDLDQHPFVDSGAGCGGTRRGRGGERSQVDLIHPGTRSGPGPIGRVVERDERRVLGGAHRVLREGAPRVEAATIGTGRGLGRRPGDGHQTLLGAVQRGDRAQQQPGVGVTGVGVEVAGRGPLDQPAAVHHQHPVGEAGDDAQVVGDEQDGQVAGLPQFVEQVEHLGLDGHVESGGRLVRDQQVGVAGQSDGDHHPLAHPARQLVGVGVHETLRPGQVHLVEEVHCNVSHRPLVEIGAVKLQRLDDLAPGLQDRVQRGERVLEDHGDPAAADPAHLPLALGQQVLAAQRYRGPGSELAPDPGNQTHDGQSGEALAAAGLADEPDPLAGADGEADVGHRHDRLGVVAALEADL